MCGGLWGSGGYSRLIQTIAEQCKDTSTKRKVLFSSDTLSTHLISCFVCIYKHALPGDSPGTLLQSRLPKSLKRALGGNLTTVHTIRYTVRWPLIFFFAFFFGFFISVFVSREQFRPSMTSQTRRFTYPQNPGVITMRSGKHNDNIDKLLLLGIVVTRIV